MILEVIFLVTNFDSTSAFFKTLCLAMNIIILKTLGGGGGGGDLGFDIPAPPPYEFLFYIN